MLVTTKSHWILFIIILLLGEIGYVATDIYLPSIPALMNYFMSTPAMVKLTITVYMFSFGVFQLVYGPISDRYGRRLTVLAGLVLTTIASLVCVVTPSMNMLIMARFFQGIGTAAGTVMARAIMCDVYSGEQLAKASSYYTIIASQLITAMPIIGGHIQATLGWRANFAILLLYTLINLLLAWKFLPETNQNKNLQAAKISSIVINYYKLLTHKMFAVNVLCSSFALSGVFAYAVSSPFLLQNILKLSPVQYGWLALVTCAAFIMGGIINTKLVDSVGTRRMLAIGGILMLLAGVLLLLPGLFGFINVILVMAPIFILIVGCNFVFSNTVVLALTPFNHLLGSSGALFGAIQLLSATLTTSLVALIVEKNQIPLAVILTALGAGVFSLYYYYLRIK